MKEAETYVVSKTSSKSMLAHMNQLVYQFEYSVTLFPSYDLVSQDHLENEIMKYPYQSGEKGEPYTTAKQYWERKISICDKSIQLNFTQIAGNENPLYIH